MNSKVHYSIHNSPPSVPILNQVNPAHAPHPTAWWSILILSSHLRLSLSSNSFPQVSPAKTLYAPLLSFLGILDHSDIKSNFSMYLIV
jgi:hypothetical protein